MSKIKHERPPEVADLSNDELLERYVQRFSQAEPDWNAFADAKLDGFRRAQRRYIGGGGSGKHDDPDVIPAANMTLSVMQMPPGQASTAHTHEVEEVLFVLQGELTVLVEDKQGNTATRKLGKWDCASCPAGVPHGFSNEGTEDVYFTVMLGGGRPGPIGYSDARLAAEELERRSKLARSA
jgi:mannose-6-phosphate isomerase-like protein (cupin superfamily)